MLLLALAASIASPLPAPARAQSRASASIMRAARATASEWEALPPGRRRELLVRDEQGRPLRLRLIENE